MKNILCYGDSNTYGYNPASGERFDENIRWPARLKKLLAPDWNVIEEGCNNRTGIFDNEAGFEQTGAKYLPVCLKKYKDIEIDTIFISLGANDLQKSYDHTDENIKNGIKKLIETAKDFDKHIRIVIVAPPVLTQNILKGNFAFQFDEDSIRQSLKMKKLYLDISIEEFCDTISMDDVAKVSDIDGLHFDEAAHKKIAAYMAEFICF